MAISNKQIARIARATKQLDPNGTSAAIWIYSDGSYVREPDRPGRSNSAGDTEWAQIKICYPQTRASVREILAANGID